jgi:predicted lipoprotein with Yx(FWY)xxD motif
MVRACHEVRASELGTNPYLTLITQKGNQSGAIPYFIFRKTRVKWSPKTIAIDDSCQGMFAVIHIVTKRQRHQYPYPFYSCDLQQKLAEMTGDGGKAAIPRRTYVSYPSRLS